MQNVLFDMVLADQYTTNLIKDSAHVNLKLENLRLYDEVFQLHHVSREKFTRSYKYYMEHPELSQPLLDSLAAMGNRLRTESYSRPVPRTVSTPPPTAPPPGSPAAIRTADSIKRRFALPVSPLRRRPLPHSSSAAKQQLPKP
ncbi:hypothetical protein GCM10011511_53360 [Puia dinghuensis]|uniref:DUF4296 domain-containing protein n=2 Tax=Puia dinghuensis TaxID=1792502 RepID=A0A8J2XU44_9BACT|nr:hypothetical protein GCM10011511_53360 [Puia dinghuensis]